MPLLLIVALILAAVNHGSPFFYQSRPGMDGKVFRIVKFKTMNDRKDEAGNLLPGHERVHAAGRIIRSLSIDELPQMLNVLRGDMSFIGPRPLLPQYMPYYDTEQARRHEVRPGITGWAQVNGRNAISWEQKFKHDVWYIDNISFVTDIRIVWLTIRKIIAREGINAATNAPLIPFDVHCRRSRGETA